VITISNLHVQHAPASRISEVKFDYDARNPGLSRLTVYLARPKQAPVAIRSWPDSSGNPPPVSPVTLELEAPGTIIVEGTVCSKVARAAVPILPPCDTCPADSVGNPISLEGGNMYFTDTDPLPGTSFFSLHRRYDSQMSRDGTVYRFGLRFRSPLDAQLHQWSDGTQQIIVVTDENGRQHTFDRTGGSYTNLERYSKMQLVAGTNGTWVLRDETLQREFDSAGNITAFRDIATGRAALISYSAGNPMRVDDAWGNWAWIITIDPATGLIQSITTETGSSSVSYSYTTQSELREVSTAAGLYRTYEYQPVFNGALVSTVKDGAGRVLESHTYDWIPRPITSVGPGGDIELMEYELAGRDADERATRITWKSGRIETRYLRLVHGRWRTVETVNGCSSCGDGAVFAYDTNGRITREQDASGYVQESTYDGQGRLTLRRTALAPSGCDPATATDRCRQSPLTLPMVVLESTDATTNTRFEYGDPNWPERATLIATQSVLDPVVERQEQLTFDSATGLRLTTSITGLSATGVQQARATTNTLYNGTESAAFAPGGTFESSWLTLPQPRLVARVDGPRTDAADITAFVYYPIDQAVPAVLRGRLAAQRNAAGHITRFESYDAFGNLLRTVDPNGVTTEATFDSLGRPTGTTLKGVTGCDTTHDPLCATDLTNTQTYAGAAALSSEQRAGGIANYEYDSRNRLQAVSRGPSQTDLRERVEYTYDPGTGNRATERTLAREAGSWVQKRLETSAFDNEGRLIRQTHADNSFISYGYDPAGRLTSVQDENHTTPNTTYSYDGAGRLTAVTQTLASAPSGVVTSYAYDTHGNLSSVTDPNGNLTTYTYNDFGELTRQVSPVTGTTTYSYDAAGNLVSTSDANAATTARTYDTLGRPLTTVSNRTGSATENVNWSYDTGVFGLGRLSSTSEPTGSTSYSYDRRGLLTTEAKTIEGATYTTRFQYDADANRSAIRYPSGTLLAYTHDFAGRPLTATYGSKSIMTSATYLPFGPLTELVYGNGTVRSVAYDQRYRITTNSLTGANGTIAGYAHGYDNAGNITSITDNVDPGYNRSFTYDDLHRLTGATTGSSLWGAGSYSYDAMGNLLQATVGAEGRTFAYNGTTPKLSVVTRNGAPQSVTFDPAGNEIQVGTDVFEYGSRNHLIDAGDVRYIYDARGVRTMTRTTVTASTTTLSSLTLAETTIDSETPVTATITLTAAAPAGGIAVALTTDNPSAATVPASVTISEGQTGVTFQITTHRSPATDSAMITAQHQESTRTASLTVVRDPRVSGLTVPLSRTGAGTDSGTVTIDTPAPSGGVMVTLTSSHTAVSVPAQVMIAAGATSASFTLTTSSVTNDLVTTISATLHDTLTATMTVYAPGVELAALSVAPRNVVGAAMTSTGTVTLTVPARAGGAVVTLSSSDDTKATVPGNVTVPEGSSSANFTITTTATSTTTQVAITGIYGTTRSDTLTITTCSGWVADASPLGSETVWFDDTLPDPGMGVWGPWIWTTAQKTSGTQSHTSGPATGRLYTYFRHSPVVMRPLAESDMIVTHMLLDPCNPPQQIVLQFWDGINFEHRAFWGNNVMQWGPEGTAAMYRIGDLPPAGRWVRVEVPAGLVGLVGANVSGMSFDYYDGQVWFDRTGIQHCTFTAEEPELPSTDTVWMDDSLAETGAGWAGGNWIWDTTKKASGTQSHTELPKAGYHGNYFYGGSASLPLVAGERLFMYVLPNPCDPPREIMLEIFDGSNWNHRAYWGENLQQNGTDGTDSRRRMGDLPPLGVWTRLEIPAEQVGLAGSTVQGMAFGVYDGQVWFDRVGKTATGTGMNQTIPTTMISSAGEETPDVREEEPTIEPKPAKAGFWRRLMRKILRRPAPQAAPPVSMVIYAQLTPQTDSTLEMKRYSLYTPELQLLAETSTSALTPWIANEYVWFNGEPIAQINVASGETSYYFNDHLGAPILQTDNTGSVVWRVERDPYGERYATRVGAERHQPLGLPGQEYDASSNRQYNIFRWYRPSWGRYTQSDPITQPRVIERFNTVSRPFAQMDATTTYGYSLQNPVRYDDRLGLAPTPGITPSAVAGCAYGVAKALENSFPGTSDKFKHCAISGLMVTTCGPALNANGTAVGASAFFGIAKEIKDLFGPGNAELADLVADYRGIVCGIKALGGGQSVETCCKGCYP
jgi:RHS repeat-associated protein